MLARTVSSSCESCTGDLSAGKELVTCFRFDLVLSTYIELISYQKHQGLY